MSFIRKFKRGGRIYLAEVENRRVDGKVVQRFIRYVGKEADGRTILSTSLSEAEVEAVKLYGPLLVLHHLATEIQLPEQLGDYSQEILSLVYAHCLDYRSLNYMPSWFERTDLNFLLNLEGLTERRLVGALNSLESLDAEAWQRRLFEGVCRHYRLRPSGVIYDVTNTYLYGRHCPLGKPGHDKEEVKGRPLIQVGLGVTQEEGFPFFHKVFDGNVHDARTLQDLVTLFGTYGLRPGLFIYDRGIVSGRNLKDIKRLHWDTLCGVPLNEASEEVLASLCRSPPIDATALSAAGGSRPSFTPACGLTNWMACAAAWPFASTSATNAMPANPAAMRSFTPRASWPKASPSNPAWNVSSMRGASCCPAPLAQAEEFDGYSCIFCTRRLPEDQMLSLYFDKDIVEKAFRQPQRHHAVAARPPLAGRACACSCLHLLSGLPALVLASVSPAAHGVHGRERLAGIGHHVQSLSPRRQAWLQALPRRRADQKTGDHSQGHRPTPFAGARLM